MNEILFSIEMEFWVPSKNRISIEVFFIASTTNGYNNLPVFIHY